MAVEITTSRDGGFITGGDNDWRVLHVAQFNAPTDVFDNFTTEALDLGGHTLLEGALTVADFAGTSETLDVTIQTSLDNATWITAKAYTQVTADGVQTPLPFPVHRWIRAVVAFGGTVTAGTVSWRARFLK